MADGKFLIGKPAGGVTTVTVADGVDNTNLLLPASGTVVTQAQIGVANSALVKTALNASGTAPIYACRAWANFNGTGTVAIRASGNVSSITDNGTGKYTVNFTTAMPDANYEINNFETIGIPQTIGAGVAILINNCHTFNVSSFVIEALTYVGSSNTTAASDSPVISISVVR